MKEDKDRRLLLSPNLRTAAAQRRPPPTRNGSCFSCGKECGWIIEEAIPPSEKLEKAGERAYLKERSVSLSVGEWRAMSYFEGALWAQRALLVFLLVFLSLKKFLVNE